MKNTSPLALLLNVGHALDHLFLLVFATAVGALAAEWGMGWNDLMPYTMGAFVMFGLGSVPAGKLGDQWGRRAMMIVFFLGLGASGLLVAATQTPWQMAAALTLMGSFAAIYHPVGIPMLVQKASRPGFTIGLNGLAGNLGIAVAALLSGFLVKHVGWRAAFVVPSLVALGCGILFAVLVPREAEAPAQRKSKSLDIPAATMARVFLVMTLTAVSGSMIFHFTTNGTGHLLAERFRGVVEDPATLGMLLAMVFALASLAQVAVGTLIDRFPLKRIYLPIVAMQIPLFLVAAVSEGWLLLVVAIAYMAAVFGAIPFTDAIVLRYVDDRMRSRVTGMRLAVSFTAASAAIWMLGPVVKAAGFSAMLAVLAAVAACTTLFVSFLPARDR
jgi:MFS family permease